MAVSPDKAEPRTTPSELRAEAVLVTTGPGASAESAAMARLTAAESPATVVSAGATESLAMAEVFIDVAGCRPLAICQSRLRRLDAARARFRWRLV